MGAIVSKNHNQFAGDESQVKTSSTIVNTRVAAITTRISRGPVSVSLADSEKLAKKLPPRPLTYLNASALFRGHAGADGSGSSDAAIILEQEVASLRQQLRAAQSNSVSQSQAEPENMVIAALRGAQDENAEARTDLRAQRGSPIKGSGTTLIAEELSKTKVLLAQKQDEALAAVQAQQALESKVEQLSQEKNDMILSFSTFDTRLIETETELQQKERTLKVTLRQLSEVQSKLEDAIDSKESYLALSKKLTEKKAKQEKKANESQIDANVAHSHERWKTRESFSSSIRIVLIYDYEENHHVADDMCAAEGCLGKFCDWCADTLCVEAIVSSAALEVPCSGIEEVSSRGLDLFSILTMIQQADVAIFLLGRKFGKLCGDDVVESVNSWSDSTFIPKWLQGRPISVLSPAWPASRGSSMSISLEFALQMKEGLSMNGSQSQHHLYALACFPVQGSKQKGTKLAVTGSEEINSLRIKKDASSRASVTVEYADTEALESVLFVKVQAFASARHQTSSASAFLRRCEMHNFRMFWNHPNSLNHSILLSEKHEAIECVRKLREYACSSGSSTALLIVGDAGSGKSALLAAAHLQILQKLSSKEHISCSYRCDGEPEGRTSISVTAARHVKSVMQRHPSNPISWCSHMSGNVIGNEISSISMPDETLEYHELHAMFRAASGAGIQVVVMLDDAHRLSNVASDKMRPNAVANKFTDHASSLESSVAIVPELLPSGIRMMLACRAGPVLTMLTERRLGVKIVNAPKLNNESGLDIAKMFTSLRRLNSADDASEKLLKREASKNPKFLQLCFEELHRLGCLDDRSSLDAGRNIISSDSLYTVVASILGSVEALFTSVQDTPIHFDASKTKSVSASAADSEAGVERSDLSVGVVGTLLRFIVCSRFGLSEYELHKLSQVPLTVVTSVMTHLRHLIPRTGSMSWVLSDIVKRAIVDRFKMHENVAAALHLHMANFFDSRPVGISRGRIAEELPHHVVKLKDAPRLLKILADSRVFFVLHRNFPKSELQMLWTEAYLIVNALGPSKEWVSLMDGLVKQITDQVSNPAILESLDAAELAFGVSELFFRNSEFQRCISVSSYSLSESGISTSSVDGMFARGKLLLARASANLAINEIDAAANDACDATTILLEGNQKALRRDICVDICAAVSIASIALGSLKQVKRGEHLLQSVFTHVR
jgi:hypothetical protein